jgi:hypothetical protein
MVFVLLTVEPFVATEALSTYNEHEKVALALLAALKVKSGVVSLVHALLEGDTLETPVISA